MATSEMIEAACRTDEELLKPTGFKQIESGHLIGELEEEVDPAEQARAARWLRRERSNEWQTILQVLGLPQGGPLTPWQDDPAVLAACLEEARADNATPLTVVEDIGEPAPPAAPRVRRGTTVRPNWQWQDDARCKGQDLVLFFGPDNERQPQKDIRERQAKAVCAQCPVRRECVDYALSRPEKHGTWGALNEDERYSERRRLMRRGIPLTPAPAISGAKRCGCCRTTKPAEEFAQKPKNSDGLSGWCLACTDKARKPTWARTDVADLEAS